MYTILFYIMFVLFLFLKKNDFLNQPHQLLELDDLVDAARAAGAWGAKMSGTGRGGLMFAIVSDEETQKKVYEALSKIASDVWCTEFK